MWNTSLEMILMTDRVMHSFSF